MRFSELCLAFTDLHFWRFCVYFVIFLLDNAFGLYDVGKELVNKSSQDILLKVEMVCTVGE